MQPCQLNIQQFNNNSFIKVFQNGGPGRLSDGVNFVVCGVNVIIDTHRVIL
jgi:hypothetical protein